MSIEKQLQQIRIIPVVALPTAEDAEPLADALVAGGLPCAEITLRTEGALKGIRNLRDRSDILLGAGTVHSAAQAEESVDAGAQFIVAPGFNPKTVAWCLENKIPIYPGISSPTDLESAMDFGLKVVKFFPAETLGGVKTLKAFSGPYGGMQFIPTGGIGPANLKDYLELPFVLACGGSWMVKGDLLKTRNYKEIERLSLEARELIGA